MEEEDEEAVRAERGGEEEALSNGVNEGREGEEEEYDGVIKEAEE